MGGCILMSLQIKGQIASTMIWIIAFIIVVFIMAGYLVYVGTIKIGDIGRGGNSLSVSQLSNAIALSQMNDFLNVKYVDLSEKKSDFVNSFLEKDYNAVFNWADSKSAIDFKEYNAIKFENKEDVDPEAEKLYNDLFNSYLEFIKDKNLDKPYFYARTGSKEIIIDNDGKGFMWRMNNQEGAFSHSFRKDSTIEPEYENKNKFFIISDKGTLIMIIFYEQDMDKLYKNE